MKVKMKLNTGAIKGFFIEHVEKIVLGIAVIVLLWFTVSIFQRESLPANLKPDAVASHSETALNSVISTPRPPDGEGVTQKPFQKIVGDFVNGHTVMEGEGPWQRGPLDDARKRTDPLLFVAEGLQATPFRGARVLNAVAGAPGMAPGMGGGPGMPALPPPPPGAVDPGGVKGKVNKKLTPGGPLPVSSGIGVGGAPAVQGPQPIPPGFVLPGPQGQGGADPVVGVIVTAGLPEGKQLEEFKRKFDLAMKAAPMANEQGGARAAANADIPQYIWWRLERTDVTDPAAPVVKVIDYGNMPKVFADVQLLGAALVKGAIKNPDGQYREIEADLKKWGARADEVVPAAFLEESWLCFPLPPILLRDWGMEAANPLILQLMQGVNNPLPGVNPNVPANPADNGFGDAVGPPGAGPAMPAQPQAMAGFPLGAHAAMGAPPPVAGPGVMGMPGMPGMQGGQPTGVPYKLYRFVDFDVEPGHTYTYRLQLFLVNPNFGLPPEVVAKPEANTMPYRETEWSKSSGPATIPVDKQILAVGGERNRHGEVKGKAAILLWDKDDSLELVKNFDLELGGVANFAKEQVKQIVDPVSRQVRDVTADFITDAALIDVRGGDDKALAADKQTGEPAELLFFGPGGKLIVVSAARDKPTIDGWEKTHKIPDNLLNPAPGGAGAGAGNIFGGPPGGAQPLPMGPQPGGLFPGMNNVPAKPPKPKAGH